MFLAFYPKINWTNLNMKSESFIVIKIFDRTLLDPDLNDFFLILTWQHSFYPCELIFGSTTLYWTSNCDDKSTLQIFFPLRLLWFEESESGYNSARPLQTTETTAKSNSNQGGQCAASSNNTLGWEMVPVFLSPFVILDNFSSCIYLLLHDLSVCTFVIFFFYSYFKSLLTKKSTIWDKTRRIFR